MREGENEKNRARIVAQKGALRAAGEQELERFAGSGPAALRENREQRERLERELGDLRQRMEAGERVDGEVQRVQRQLKQLREDEGRIVEAGL